MKQITLIATLLLLTACGSTNTPPPTGAQSTPPPAQTETAKKPAELTLDRLRKLYERTPENPYRIRRYAGALETNKHYQEAYTILAPLGDSEKARPEDFQTLATLASHNGQKATARNWLRKALAQDPSNFEARMKLAESYEQAEKMDKAKALYQEALTHNKLIKRSERKAVIDSYILNLIAQQQHNEALTYLITAKEEYPHNRDIEKHLRITRALMQSYGHSIPKPTAKPAR